MVIGIRNPVVVTNYEIGNPVCVDIRKQDAVGLPGNPIQGLRFEFQVVINNLLVSGLPDRFAGENP